MDRHSSPYLDAIQTIPGLTPGQKYRELNSIAKKAASKAKSHGDVATFQITIDGVPEPLVPLVEIEIANILRQNEVLSESLKSEDCVIVDRALRVNWFFCAKNKQVINAEYFSTNLFPAITLNTRIKLIKKLVASFNATGDTAAAEAFYTLTSETYGKTQAEPLLVACSTSFIWETIKRRKMILSCRMMKNLFVKHPDLVVRYLKLSKNKSWPISKYSNFLPRLIKNHLKTLIELIETHDCCLGIKLSNKATERFLKSNVDVVLQRPNLYTSMMPLKVIAAKITKSQYKRMFAKVYPPKSKDFQYRQVQEYLKYYPEQERIALLLETYEKVYNANMLDNHDLIGSKILQMLPAHERVRQARIKLAEDPDWQKNRRNVEKIWRCYLPLEEIIPLIKTEISKTSSPDDRLSLIQQMFFVCRVNDDKDALLDALRYFTTRHKNEQPYVIFEVLSSILENFDMSTFGKDHWSIINDFMKFLNVKDQLIESPTTSSRILTFSIHFNLIHDLPIDDGIDMMIEINMKAWNASWCILEKYPEYDRICFNRMMSRVPQKYPKDHEIWSKWGLSSLQNIVKSISNFNNRNTGKSSSNKMEKLSIKNYDWLLEAIEKLLKNEKHVPRWKLDSIIQYLKIYEPDLYEKWIPAKPSVIGDFKTGEALKFLKEDSRKVLERCDEYLESMKGSIISETMTRRFVKACRWYQDIPTKFFNRCLENLKKEGSDYVLLILAILMEGSEFSRIIEPIIVQNLPSMDSNNDDAKSMYSTLRMIPRAMNLSDPPVSLNLVAKFCDGDYLDLGLITLTNLSRRTSIEKIKKFTKELTDRRISVRKHGIRLYCLVAANSDYRDFLSSLWKTEKHRSIREVIFTRIYGLFIDQSSSENWTLLRDCMNDLKNDDDDIVSFIGSKVIPDTYTLEYISHTLETLERLQADGLNDVLITNEISRFLLRIDDSKIKLLTEEFAERLMEKYFCNASHARNVSQAGMSYTLHTYLRADESKLEHRLVVFGKRYVDVLRKYWNVPDSKVPMYFPVNSMSHRFVHDYVYRSGVDTINVKIMKKLLESFSTVLKPEQDWTTWALLTYGIALEGAKDSKLIAEKISETLPRFVDVLSSVLVIELDQIVNKWLEALVDCDDLDRVKYRVIQTLCRKDTEAPCTLAAKLLFRNTDRQHETIRNDIVEFLKSCKYPVAVSLVCQHINSFDGSQ